MGGVGLQPNERNTAEQLKQGDLSHFTWLADHDLQDEEYNHKIID